MLQYDFLATWLRARFGDVVDLREQSDDIPF